MSLEFKSGNYAVQAGKTFSDSADNTHNYYTFRFNSKLDPTMPSRTASLRQENDTFFADWTLADDTLSYEGVKGNIQELECLLIFDEDTQTFTLERPSLKTTLKKSRKKKPTGSTDGKQKSKSKVATSSSSTNNGKGAMQQQKSPMSLALPSQQTPKDTPGTATSSLTDNDNSDSFDDDILRDMDEILNSSDDDDDDDNDDNEEFETIATPHVSNDSMQIDSVPLPPPPPPLSNSPRLVTSPGNQQQQSSSTPGSRRRHVLKMASAPIRRLDSSPPTPAPTSSMASIPPPPPPLAPESAASPSISNKRPRTSGKTISAETLAARRKAASAIRSDSSSGSSSSGSDSSSDDSSESGGSDSDDDMDSLEANISRGLSEDEANQPRPSGTTPNHMRHLTPNPLTPSSSNRGSSNGATRPTSLRDLLGKGDQRDDDNVSSSDDDDG